VPDRAAKRAATSETANAVNTSQTGLHPRCAARSELKAMIAPNPTLLSAALKPGSQTAPATLLNAGLTPSWVGTGDNKATNVKWKHRQSEADDQEGDQDDHHDRHQCGDRWSVRGRAGRNVELIVRMSVHTWCDPDCCRTRILWDAGFAICRHSRPCDPRERAFYKDGPGIRLAGKIRMNL
jgi:hypothetical protein